LGARRNVILSLSLIFVIGFTSSQNVYSEEPITVTTDKLAYTDGEKIIVTGQVGVRLDNPFPFQ